MTYISLRASGAAIGLFIGSAVVMLFFATSVKAETLGANLIANPSFETAASSSLPLNWKKGGYGSNTRVLEYPVAPAHSGTKAARTTISNYVSGDAKWYFTPLALNPGATYQFLDYYSATVPTEVDAQVTHADGSTTYIVLGHPALATSYMLFSSRFVVPSDATSVVIFHVINRNGSLTVDDYALQKVTPDINLIANGNFESSSVAGAPTGWRTGGWGSNTHSFTYPASGQSGNGAQVTISSYSSGDAKWYFTPITVPNGIYTYSDSYRSSAPSQIVLQLHNADGSYSYDTLASLPAVSSFTTASIGLVVPSGTQDITIFHLISSVGSLTIDNASLVHKTYSSGIFSTGAVTLTFDNGWLSQYQNAEPTLKNLGLVGTFYIITHELADYGFTGYMSKKQIQQLYADGMEIGSHTQTHPDLPPLSFADQQQEIQNSQQDLLALNVGPIDSLAYPYGDYDATSTTLAQAYYTNARATLTGYTLPDSDVYHLPRQVVLTTTSAVQIEQWIDEAASDKVWLILEFHQVDTSGSTYAITPTEFNQVMQYLANKNVPVITMHQGVQYLQ